MRIALGEYSYYRPGRPDSANYIKYVVFPKKTILFDSAFIHTFEFGFWCYAECYKEIMNVLLKKEHDNNFNDILQKIKT